jgi:glycine/D-amino acid oxidase-like deaminating enzyme
MTELSKYSVDLYRRLRLNGDPCYHEVGSMEVAWTNERWEDLKRKAGFAKSWGLEPELLSASEARGKIPIMTDKILGAIHIPTDGVAKCVEVTEAMGRSAQDRGVAFYPRTTVTGIDVQDGQVEGVVTSRGRIRTNIVVAAGGIWGPLLGRMAGVAIPLSPMEHPYVETGPLPELAGETEEISHPILRHQDASMYFRQWGERYAFGSYRHDPQPVDADDILSHEDASGDAGYQDLCTETRTASSLLGAGHYSMPRRCRAGVQHGRHVLVHTRRFSHTRRVAACERFLVCGSGVDHARGWRGQGGG